MAVFFPFCSTGEEEIEGNPVELHGIHLRSFAGRNGLFLKNQLDPFFPECREELLQ
jgi:hypothetical protein